MKKIFLLGAMVCALGMMTACKSNGAQDTDGNPIVCVEDTSSLCCSGLIEPDRQLPLLGEWKINEVYRTTHLHGKEETDTATPDVSWRFADDGYYYETVRHEGKEDTYQYGYVLHGDSIMLREETEYDDPWWTAWWVIDTLSQDRLVLVADDADMVLRVTLQRINTDK